MLFEKIAVDVKEKLLVLSPVEDVKLPSTRVMAAKYSVNHLTVTKAYAKLEKQGILYRKRGKGTFCCASAIESERKKLIAEFTQVELPKMISKALILGVGLDDIKSQLQGYVHTENPVSWIFDDWGI